MTTRSRLGARDGADPTASRVQPADACPARARSPRRAQRKRVGDRASRGSVTVELVGVIPLLVAVTLAMVGLIAVARDQVLAQGAAREGAREAALGANEARAASAARAALPPGRAARVTVIAADPDRVRVRVELGVRLLFGVPPLTVRAEGVALREPGPAPQPAGP
jgi:TadE-like protein